MSFTKWHQELERFRSFKTTFLVEGNIHDLHSYPTQTNEGIRWDMLTLDRYLFTYLLSVGYDNVIFYNHIDGFYNEYKPEHLEVFLNLSGEKIRIANPFYEATIDKASNMIRKALINKEVATVVVMNLASRYVTSPDSLSEEESQFYSRLYLSTMKLTQVKKEKIILNNLLFIVPNKMNDIPAWFYLDNPHIKALHLSKPDHKMRERFFETQQRFFQGSEQFTKEETERFKEKFVDLTEGFKNLELNGLRKLCAVENIPINKIADAISLYKYGIKDNPWTEISDQKLANAETFIKSFVKGQNAAITQTLDIVKRAVSGMSGLQHSSSSSKPKGILFFAGPTGTGKTELAKTLSRLLFGDETACVRFDMSEYQQSHSDQKLLGAPPGYVGYEAGGQLTNALKEKPFSILLFDEIEKAHPSILDKFLQILEDGRMTDGQGETAYFSESIIIFTSNLGIYKKDDYGRRISNVTMEMSYKDIEQEVTQAIKEYFTIELGRPEILNRIGNNFVVFDYIREDIAQQIIQSQLNKITLSLRETRNITVEIGDLAQRFIYHHAMNNLENGGRGIGNIIEKYFINPLSRYLYDHKVKENKRIMINRIEEMNDIVQIIGLVGETIEN